MWWGGPEVGWSVEGGLQPHEAGGGPQLLRTMEEPEAASLQRFVYEVEGTVGETSQQHEVPKRRSDVSMGVRISFKRLSDTG